MTWNYRVFEKEGVYAIHEVFYRNDGSIEGYTENPVFPRADSLVALAEEMQRYAAALAKEPLRFDV